MIALYDDAQRDLLRRSMNVWGQPSQINMVVEECAELISSIQRYERGRTKPADVIDEVADVLITLGYLVEVFGEDAVKAQLARKWDRLRERVEAAEGAA